MSRMVTAISYMEVRQVILDLLHVNKLQVGIGVKSQDDGRALPPPLNIDGYFLCRII